MQKPKKKLLKSLSILVVLSSCGSFPKAPQHTQYSIIKQDPVEKSYAFGKKWYDDGKDYTVFLPEFLDKSPVCVSADDYATLRKYAEDAKDWVKTNCQKKK